MGLRSSVYFTGNAGWCRPLAGGVGHGRGAVSAPCTRTGTPAARRLSRPLSRALVRHISHVLKPSVGRRFQQVPHIPSAAAIALDLSWCRFVEALNDARGMNA